MNPTRISLCDRVWYLAPRVAMAASLVTLGACKSLLEVDNPNNVSSGALEVPAAAPAILAGAENLSANAVSSMLNFYVPASDEAYWVGSRDDYRLLNSGEFGINVNEYVQSAYLVVSRARWMSDQAVQKIEKFNTDGQLLDKQLLVRAYLNDAIIYTDIADAFDDFVFSDRTVAGPNVGEANMAALYDSAVKWLDLAAPLATNERKAAVLGMRARAKFEKAVWQKLNPPGTTPANKLVNDAGATADAQAALALMAGDFKWDQVTNDLNEGDGSGGGFGFEMNSRVEYTPNKTLADIDPNNNKPKAVNAKDPVTGLVDATAVKQLGRVIFPAAAGAINHPPLTAVSEREMRLIIAEAALAAGNTGGFDTAINALRAMDGKAPYTGAGPTRIALLEWERRVNLIFQLRRINDMYRFGTVDPDWIPTSLAVKKPGCLFPIPLIEREANKLVTGTPVCS